MSAFEESGHRADVLPYFRRSEDQDRGAEGIILGCTEIMLLVRPEDSAVPLFDTTRLHVESAIARALAAR